MTNPAEPLQFVIRVKDDGTAVLERVFGTIKKGATQAANSVNQVNSATGNTTINIKRLDASVKQAADNTDRFSLKLLGAVYAGRQLFQATQAWVQGYTQYQDSLNRLSAKTLTDFGNMNPMFGELKKRSEELAMTTKFSATEIAHGMAVMAQAGQSASQILRNIQPVLNLATNEMIGLEQAAQIGLTVQTALLNKSDDLTRVFDILANVSAKSRLNAVDIGESWKYIGAQATQAGFDIETTTAILGTFAETAVTASMGGTAFRSMLVRILKPSEDGTIALKKLGIIAGDGTTSYKNNADALLQVIGRLHELQSAGQNVDRMVLDIFGTRFVGPMSTFVREYEKFLELQKEAYNSNGQNARMSQEMMKGLTGEVKIAQSAWDRFLNTAAETLEGPLSGAVSFLTRSLNYFTAVLDTSDATMKNLGGFANASLKVNNAKVLASFDEGTLFSQSVRPGGQMLAAGAKGHIPARLVPGALEGFNSRTMASLQADLAGLMSGASGAASSAASMFGSAMPWSKKSNVGLLDDKGGMSFMEKAEALAKKIDEQNRKQVQADQDMARSKKERAQQVMEALRMEVDAERAYAEKQAELREQRRQEQQDELENFRAIREAYFELDLESTYDNTANSLLNLNDLFLSSANQRERILFESNARTSVLLLDLVAKYKQAAFSQVGVERAKKNLMFGIAGETAKGLLDLFVRGEEGRFKAAKLFASAEALINAHQAASQVLADKTLPTPLKYGAAAAIFLAGLGRVRAINATTPGATGGGDAAPTGADAFAGANIGATDDVRSLDNTISRGRGGTAFINITVDGFVGNKAELVSELVDQLKEAKRDGLNVVFQGGD